MSPTSCQTAPPRARDAFNCASTKTAIIAAYFWRSQTCFEKFSSRGTHSVFCPAIRRLAIGARGHFFPAFSRGKDHSSGTSGAQRRSAFQRNRNELFLHQTACGERGQATRTGWRTMAPQPRKPGRRGKQPGPGFALCVKTWRDYPVAEIFYSKSTTWRRNHVFAPAQPFFQPRHADIESRRDIKSE